MSECGWCIHDVVCIYSIQLSSQLSVRVLKIWGGGQFHSVQCLYYVLCDT